MEKRVDYSRRGTKMRAEWKESERILEADSFDSKTIF
jgi:hypothetical protein